MDLKTVLYDLVGSTAVISLSRPSRHNAWTGRMHTEYRWLLQEAESDPDVKVIVVTGDPVGGAFCVGADSEALSGHVTEGGYVSGTDDDIPTPGFGVNPAFDADFAYHFGLTKPVVAAINGATAGVGLALACFADLRFAAVGSKLTAVHGKLRQAGPAGGVRPVVASTTAHRPWTGQRPTSHQPGDHGRGGPRDGPRKWCGTGR